MNSPDDQISIKFVLLKFIEWKKIVVSRWRLIVTLSLIGALLGFSYALLKRKIYTATSTFVLEEGEGTAGTLGQYAGIASMVGIDVGGEGSLFKGDNILELYKSRKMIVKSLLTTVNVNDKPELLIDQYLDVYSFRTKWKDKPALLNVKFSEATKDTKAARLQDSILDIAVDNINKNILDVDKPDKKLSIIKADVKSIDESFSKNFNDIIVKTVNDFYIQTKTKKALQNLNILQHQVDSIRSALNGAISGVAALTDVNPNLNPSRQILRVPSQKKQVDVEANRAILSELVKNLEISKVSLRKETPLIQTIDVPTYPLYVEKPSKIKLLIVGFILGTLISSFIVIVKQIANNL